MRVRKLVKIFEFEERKRRVLTLGSDVRLNPSTHKLQLEATDNFYSTDSDLYAKTWVTNPRSVKQWLGFDVEATHYRNSSGVYLTSLAFRLSDGTDEYWWNGGSWEVNTVDWNTEEEVATNIQTFPVASQKIQVIINLRTSDKNYTPLVSRIKILWASDIEFMEDIIARSMIPFLRENVRPISDYPIEKISTSSSIDLNDFALETPYNLIGIDSVFDHTNDPDHLNDLFQSYDSGTKIITLSSDINSGDVSWIRFTYEPEVALSTSQEYSELDKVPQILLKNLKRTNRRQLGTYEYVRDKAAGTAVKLSPLSLEDIQFTLQIVTASQRDQQRIVDNLGDVFEDNTQITSRNLDENYDIWHAGYMAQPSIGQKDIYSGIMDFEIKNVRFYLGRTYDVHIVENMELNFELN